MARATVTIRELKNKDTGIDLSVTSYKETKGMLGSSYEYQVMVVSNLSYFKSAKHKEADNVQFTVMKKLNDFEEIHSKFNTKYSGTAFPQLPKKVLMMNDSIAKERRNNLDHFLRYLASTPKLCTDPILLEFLGVSAMKAGKLRKMEVSESKVNKDDNSDEVTDKQEAGDASNIDNNEDDENLFDDEDYDKNADDEDNDLFGPEDISTNINLKGDLKIFDEPDLSGALEDGEGDDLFITGSKSEVKVTSPQPDEDNEESNDDLFSVDDDLDKIMKMSLKPENSESVEQVNDEPKLDVTNSEPKAEAEEQEKAEPVQSKPESEDKPFIPKGEEPIETKENDSTIVSDFDSVTAETKLLTDTTAKEKVRPKPALRKKPDIGSKPDLNPKPGLKPKPGASPTKPDTPTKPGIPNKPELPNKPGLPSKPGVPSKPGIPNKPGIPSKPGIPNKPGIPSKPGIPNKPSIATKSDNDKTDSTVNANESKKDTSAAVDITEDDIMKYIQENTQGGDDDLDLFS